MWFQLVGVLVLVLPIIVTSNEIKDQGSSVASTSQRPPQNQTYDDRLRKLEEGLEFYAKLEESGRRLEALEFQNKQMQQMLENINSVVTNFTVMKTELTASKDKIEAMELRTEQIQTRLLNIDSDLANVTNIFHSTQSCDGFPRDCKEVKERGKNRSKVYRIKPELAPKPFSVFCDMETRGGVWAYIVNRFDGSQDFDLNWKNYKNGFGDPAGEYWLGLEHQYELTGSAVNELLFELVNQDEKKLYAYYDLFKVSNESEGYQLSVMGKGDISEAGESFIQHAGAKFSTKDRDQDSSAANCAVTKSGGWWYKDCDWAKLTGRYLREKGHLKKRDYGQGIHWGQFSGFDNSLKQAKMMIRRRDGTSAR